MAGVFGCQDYTTRTAGEQSQPRHFVFSAAFTHKTQLFDRKSGHRDGGSASPVQSHAPLACPPDGLATGGERLGGSERNFVVRAAGAAGPAAIVEIAALLTAAVTAAGTFATAVEKRQG